MSGKKALAAMAALSAFANVPMPENRTAVFASDREPDRERKARRKNAKKKKAQKKARKRGRK